MNIQEENQDDFLDLSDKNLIEVPREIFNFNNITQLDLSKNLISELPDDFSKLSNLEYLNLGANLIDVFPKVCLLYTSPSPRDATLSRMPSSA